MIAIICKIVFNRSKHTSFPQQKKGTEAPTNLRSPFVLEVNCVLLQNTEDCVRASTVELSLTHDGLQCATGLERSRFGGDGAESHGRNTGLIFNSLKGFLLEHDHPGVGRTVLVFGLDHTVDFGGKDLVYRDCRGNESQ